MNAMENDRTRSLLLALIIAIALLPIMFLATGILKIVTAIVLSGAAIAVYFLIPKRGAHSVNARQVIMLMGTVAAVYLTLWFLSGLYFRYQDNFPPPSIAIFLRYTLPGLIIIIATEIIRTVFLAQKRLVLTLLVYAICVFSEICLGKGFMLGNAMSFYMDFIAQTILPAMTANLLYHYASAHYGMIPNLLYRGLLFLVPSLLPIVPAIPPAVEAIVLLLLPLGVMLFLKLLFEKRSNLAAKKKSPWKPVVSIVCAVFMISIVMLTTCRFHYGMLVIATPSMEGELNVGDAVVFEAYENDVIQKDDIIVFSKNGETRVVHRVVDIENINGQFRYYTQGDANQDRDDGYVTPDQIVGIVHFKVPMIGQPSLWLRSLFD